MSDGLGERERANPFSRRALGVAVLGVVLFAAWYLRDLLLLVFAAILVACLLASISRLFSSVLNVPRPLAFGLACLTLVLLAAGFFWLLGVQLRGQMVELWEQLPELLKPIESAFNIGSIEDWLGERLEEMLSQTSVMSRIAGFSSAAFGFLANVVLVVVAGFYLALQPSLYTRGVIRLFPHSLRPKVGATLVDIGDGLRHWLFGQFIAMLLVGVLTYAGLSLIGLPSALALAVIAGLLEFVPFFGPIAAAVPAVALGLAEGQDIAIYVGLLYLAIQQLEGNLIVPLIQRRWVRLPPAVTLFAILASGVAFGWLGILLATPLAVALMILVKDVWVASIETELPQPTGRADVPRSATDRELAD